MSLPQLPLSRHHHHTVTSSQGLTHNAADRPAKGRQPWKRKGFLLAQSQTQHHVLMLYT